MGKLWGKVSWVALVFVNLAHGIWWLPNYRRPKVTGACVFFTVNLAARGSRLLVNEIDRLRDAVRVTRRERPFP